MMTLFTLKQELARHCAALVRFRLPDGSLSAPHAHITEVGLVTKSLSFIDCGGTIRSESKCLLQSWVADDLDHRVSAEKLLSIIEKAATILQRDDISVELEHDVGFAAQFPLVSAQRSDGELIIEVAARHTACLAPEKCCPPAESQPIVSLARKR